MELSFKEAKQVSPQSDKLINGEARSSALTPVSMLSITKLCCKTDTFTFGSFLTNFS